MASERAKNAARLVLERTGKGKRVVMGEILREVGYGEGTIVNPQQVTETDSFKSVINPFVAKMEKERDRVIQAMAGKELDVVQYSHLTNAIDSMTKNIQLLSGGETERTGVTVNVVKYE